MMTENFRKLLFTPILFLIVIWILFNPYICYWSSEFISNFSFLTNDFCKNIGLNYRFSSEDILNLMRFLEYFIFGIFSAVLYKLYFKKSWHNIANPLFVGLLVSILEVYFKGFEICKSGVQNILISFFEFCAGLLIVLVCCMRKNKSIFSSKYKKNKYMGRN